MDQKKKKERREKYYQGINDIHYLLPHGIIVYVFLFSKFRHYDMFIFKLSLYVIKICFKIYEIKK